MNLQGFCRNDGDPNLVAGATVAGTIVNVFLDWILVYPLQTGVEGAAIALNVIRSFLTNTFSILVLPMIFGESIIWYTYGISEVMVTIIAVLIVRSVHRESRQS